MYVCIVFMYVCVYTWKNVCRHNRCLLRFNTKLLSTAHEPVYLKPLPKEKQSIKRTCVSKVRSLSIIIIRAASFETIRYIRSSGVKERGKKNQIKQNEYPFHFFDIFDIRYDRSKSISFLEDILIKIQNKQKRN